MQYEEKDMAKCPSALGKKKVCCPLYSQNTRRKRIGFLTQIRPSFVQIERKKGVRDKLKEKSEKYFIVRQTIERKRISEVVNMYKKIANLLCNNYKCEIFHVFIMPVKKIGCE